MVDLAWFIDRKYKMRHTLTLLSNHCKFQRVPHATISITNQQRVAKRKKIERWKKIESHREKWQKKSNRKEENKSFRESVN